jgi:hypothetical protein
VVAWYEKRSRTSDDPKARDHNGPRVVRVNALGDIDEITKIVTKALGK